MVSITETCHLVIPVGITSTFLLGFEQYKMICRCVDFWNEGEYTIESGLGIEPRSSFSLGIITQGNV